MAPKSTVIRIQLDIADMNNHHYEKHSLTLAMHPSETEKRLMVRILAFALNAHEDLKFGRGLSNEDDPALWIKDLRDRILLWIDVGHPDDKRLTRSLNKSDQMKVYCYGGAASELWWQKMNNKGFNPQKLSVYSFDPEPLSQLESWVKRSMDLSCCIQDSSILLTQDGDSMTLELEELFA